MSEYTKGPWKVGYNDGSGKFGKYQGTYQSFVTVDNHLLATVWHHDDTDYPKDHPIMIAQDNAHLIAAAPELYEALKALFNDVVSAEIYDLDEQALLVAASEALAKADGKP